MGQLVLGRKHKERIKIGKNIFITVYTKRLLRGGKSVNQVSIGVDAPKDIKVLRTELLANG
jgi:carbon storage regulator CsrA